jgi:hypothetical protein
MADTAEKYYHLAVYQARGDGMAGGKQFPSRPGHNPKKE